MPKCATPYGHMGVIFIQVTTWSICYWAFSIYDFSIYSPCCVDPVLSLGTGILPIAHATFALGIMLNQNIWVSQYFAIWGFLNSNVMF